MSEETINPEAQTEASPETEVQTNPAFVAPANSGTNPAGIQLDAIRADAQMILNTVDESQLLHRPGVPDIYAAAARIVAATQAVPA